jgi:hypothetical protein
MTLKYSTIVKSLTIVFFISSCALNSKPDWITDPNAIVGFSGFIPSQNYSIKKDIALKKAIHSLMLKKGKATGSILIKSNKNYLKINNQENYEKNVKQNSTISFKFKDVAYNVKITGIYIDKITQDVYVRIEER